MPLFRFHRGGLDESLATTVIVKTHRQLRKVIKDSFGDFILPNAEFKLEVKPYPSKQQSFDARIGWYTQMVKANWYKEDEMHPVGFLSEPLEDI